MLSGLPVTDALGYPPHCSSEGTTYLEIYDKAELAKGVAVAELYSISPTGKITRIQRQYPQNAKDINVLSVYPGDDEIATLLSAEQSSNAEDDPHADTLRYYISLSKSDGTFLKLLTLALKFNPVKIAVLDSGKFAALGVDPLNRLPVLALLDADGTYIRPIDFDATPYGPANSLKTIFQQKEKTGSSQEATLAAIHLAQFAPYGSKALFYQPGSNLPLRILGSAGEENTIRISPPRGYVLESIVSAPQDGPMIVRVQAISGFAELQAKGVVENPPQKLVELNRYTGEAIRFLNVSGANTQEITCAEADRLIAPQLVDDKNPTGGQWILLEGKL